MYGKLILSAKFFDDVTNNRSVKKTRKDKIRYIVVKSSKFNIHNLLIENKIKIEYVQCQKSNFTRRKMLQRKSFL